MTTERASGTEKQADFETYFRDLKLNLEGKDLSRVGPRCPRGRVFLLFKELPGADQRRVSIRLHDGGVQVSEEPVREGDRHVVVRSTLESWIDYCKSGDERGLAEMELYGDSAILGTLGKLMRAPKSAIDVRVHQSQFHALRRAKLGRRRESCRN